MKIGVENFRIFKDYQEFDIRPLTFLIGPNNSGKSALSKLFLLLQESLHKLNFDSGRHKMGSYQSAVTKGSNKESFTVTFDMPIDYFDENVRLQIEYTGDFPSSIKAILDDELLFRLDLGETLINFSTGTVETMRYTNKNSEEYQFYLVVP